MNPRDPDISPEEMRSLFSYDPSTGQITRTSGRFSGVAGYRHHSGYRMLKVRGRSILAQRVAWVLHHGEWPGELFIDHINRDKTDNRIANLRLATNAQNLANVVVTSAASGLRGVYYDKRKKTGRKWLAVIRVPEGETYLGCFHTPEEASAAYRVAAVKARGEFAVPIEVHIGFDPPLK